MSSTYTIHCLSEAMSPISHMSGSVGNEGIVAREPVLTERGTVYIPFLSGNALRHRAIREPGMLWLIDRYELRGKLTLPTLNFLLHGGNLMGSTGFENTKLIAEMYRLWPLLRLCGGSLPNQILAGSLDCWRGTLVCEENRDYLAAVGATPPELRMLSAEAFIGAQQYTRGDGKKTGLAAPSDEPGESNLMIFSGQVVNRRAMFHHGFILKSVSELEVGALLLSLRLWQATGGTIGGQAARGHGRLKTTILYDGPDEEFYVDNYVGHVLEVKNEAVAWLNSVFAPKAEKKPTKGKKGKTTEGQPSLLPEAV